MKPKKDTGLIAYDPLAELTDVNLLKGAIQECLEDNDFKEIISICETYLKAKSTKALGDGLRKKIT